MGLKSAASKLVIAGSATTLVGIGVNSTVAHKNAEQTCAALAEGQNPTDRTFEPYYGTPLPLVNDPRFGLELPGGPIFRNLHGNSFEPWSLAGMDDANRIADYCNAEFALFTEGNLTAEQVEIVLLKADSNYAAKKLQ